MKSILIVEPSDMIRTDLEAQLRTDHRVYACASAEEAEDLLMGCQPEGLLINLRLPGMDGLYFLEQHEQYLPSVIITLAAAYSPQLEQRLADLGVSHMLVTCCPLRTVAHHMRSFLAYSHIRVPASRQDTVSAHLRILGISHHGGFDDLRVGTPLFAQDPSMSMTKEFYPAVATLRGRENWQQVEKAIRAAKEAAYENRNDAIWKEYFPDTSHCPKNKAFIARLAEFIS